MADLTFVYGAMGAGKSTELIMRAYDFESESKKVFLIKPIIDDKGSDTVMNRFGLERKVDYLVKPTENMIHIITSLRHRPDVIIIDEAQFLTADQVDQLFLISKEFNIPVLAYGIRSDFKQNPFSGSPRLFTIADNIKELEGKICNCGKKATQNIRLYKGIPTFEGESVLIDKASDVNKKGKEVVYSYKSVCGDCYVRTRRKYSKIEDNKNW